MSQIVESIDGLLDETAEYLVFLSCISDCSDKLREQSVKEVSSIGSSVSNQATTRVHCALQARHLLAIDATGTKLNCYAKLELNC
ncbi:hypothetical protein LIER_07682 [Lithospermum erythrorhizon]|uniref:Uncharacterized protein n=1 Tax=Lithospermum erythrorhizon TaxID=34254 RepID=A0AAV3PBV2_LITER